MRKLLITFLCILPTLAMAQVYTWINDQGVRVYSDEAPPAHAKEANLAPIIPLAPLKVEASDNKDADVSGFTGYRYFAFTNPTEDATITPDSAGSVTVQLAIQPQLQAEDEVVLFLDGRIAETSQSLSFTLSNLDRGSHLIYAEVRHQGKRLIQTKKRSIHVQRPSVAPKKAPK